MLICSNRTNDVYKKYRILTIVGGVGREVGSIGMLAYSPTDTYHGQRLVRTVGMFIPSHNRIHERSRNHCGTHYYSGIKLLPMPCTKTSPAYFRVDTMSDNLRLPSNWWQLTPPQSS